jgi:hypothetical protein
MSGVRHRSLRSMLVRWMAPRTLEPMLGLVLLSIAEQLLQSPAFVPTDWIQTPAGSPMELINSEGKSSLSLYESL